METVNVNDLNLVMLPIEDPAFAGDPDPGLAKAREQHPWLARYSHGYVIHSYKAMRELIVRDDKLQLEIQPLIDIMGANGTPWGDFMAGLIVGRRGQDHQRIRGAVADFFRPRNVNKFVSRMREVVDELLNDWLPRGGFDFTEFAAKFPIAIMFDLIGGDLEDLSIIQNALETQGLSFSLDATLLPELEAGYAVMMAYTEALVAKRRASAPKDDLLQSLIACEDRGELTPLEVRELLFFLFGAGYDTSKNQLTLAVWMLIGRPDLWKRCASDRKYCVLATEEAFRLASPSNLPRTVVDDFSYQGVHLPKGTSLLFITNVATRDPAVAEDPLLYDPDRPQINRHLAFGRGLHQCMGMHLARLQIEEGLHIITQRMENPRLTAPIAWRRFPGVWGLQTLPVEFDVAEAGAS